MKVNKVTPKDSLFPEALRHILTPPKQLFVLGDLEPLKHTKVISIVGSRAVTPYGQQVTTRLSGELAGRGMTDINELSQASELPPEVFSQTMTMLEITAKIRPLGAGHWGLQ